METLTSKPGQMELVSFFKQIHLQEGNFDYKPMLKTDRLSHLFTWAHNGSLTLYINQMIMSTSNSRDGALPVETHQTGGVPGSLSRRSPPYSTRQGGHPILVPVARRQGHGVKNYRCKPHISPNSDDFKSLRIRQWNAKSTIYRDVKSSKKQEE